MRFRIEDGLSFQSGSERRGAFTNEFFKHLKKGKSIGEAFIRTDIKLNSKKNNDQDPKAGIRNKRGRIIQVSSLENEPDIFDQNTFLA